MGGSEGSVTNGNFVVDGVDGWANIRLRQLDRKNFALESTIVYEGVTGLGSESAATKALRKVEPRDVPKTDLASVPKPFRWWVNTYGVHTPAAIIHDRFIPSPLLPDVTDQQVDRYFRFMLQDLGVRWAKRWLMWAAVAFRTRWEDHGRRWKGWRRWSLILWIGLAIVGTAALVYGVIDGNWIVALLAFAAPLLASPLWYRQAGAGVIAAYVGIPLLLFPGVVVGLFLLLYLAVEWVFSCFADDDRAGTEPYLRTGD